MYVLGINGSPRRGGNTELLLDKALEGALAAGAKTDKANINCLKFSACQECGTLSGDGSCKIEDGMRAVYKKIKDADAVIMASPIFFGSLSAQTKMMIDRFQCAWIAGYILKKSLFKKRKKGALILVEASDRKDFFENAKAIVKNFFAVINAEYKKELFCKGVDKKGAILKHGAYLKKAYELGRDIAT